MILFELEAPPRFRVDCMNDQEEARLQDWLEATKVNSLLVAAAELATNWPRAT